MDLSKYIVDLHGKPYMTVAGRILEFWDRAGEKAGLIATEMRQEGNVILVKATATYGNRSATGHASEVIGGAGVNRTNALENAETSAVGRALGNLGLGLLTAGGVASADEVQGAMAKGTSPADEIEQLNSELAGEPVVQQEVVPAAPQYACSECLVPITEAEHKYSMKIYRRPLCRQHQATARPSRSTTVK